ncbi:hypothetical protein BpHYR1_042661, partial [Brachionus plicatilis]
TDVSSQYERCQFLFIEKQPKTTLFSLQSYIDYCPIHNWYILIKERDVFRRFRLYDDWAFENEKETQGWNRLINVEKIRVQRRAFVKYLYACPEWGVLLERSRCFVNFASMKNFNKLPENLVESKSTANFKMALDKVNGIGSYSSRRPIGGDELRNSTC